MPEYDSGYDRYTFVKDSCIIKYRFVPEKHTSDPRYRGGYPNRDYGYYDRGYNYDGGYWDTYYRRNDDYAFVLWLGIIFFVFLWVVVCTVYSPLPYDGTYAGVAATPVTDVHLHDRPPPKHDSRIVV